MKFILPLFLSLASVSDAILSEIEFNLDPPGSNFGACGDPTVDSTLFTCTGFTQTDAQTISVKFAHGAGSGTPGTTSQLITVGPCYLGNDFPNPAQSTSGITIGALSTGQEPASADVYTTSYVFSLDLSDPALELTDAETSAATIDLCVNHYFTDINSGIIPNFQQTEVKLTYDLETSDISNFLFQTAATDPAVKDDLAAVEVSANAQFCGSEIPVNQGEIVCVKVCPGTEGLGYFSVTTIVSATATLAPPQGSPVVNTVSQDLTDGSGAVDQANTNIVDVAATSNGLCLQIQFYLKNEFFAVFEELVLSAGQSQPQFSYDVELTGTALLAQTARRLGSNARALQSRVTDSEFEMDITLAQPEGTSGSVVATVTRFTLVGAAGAALLI